LQDIFEFYGFRKCQNSDRFPFPAITCKKVEQQQIGVGIHLADGLEYFERLDQKQELDIDDICTLVEISVLLGLLWA